MSLDNSQTLDNSNSHPSPSIDQNISSSTTESQLSPSQYPLPTSPIIPHHITIENAISQNDIVLLHDTLIKQPSFDLNTFILKDGRTPLMSAAHSGSVDVLNFLLYRIAVDVNSLGIFQVRDAIKVKNKNH